MAPPPAAAAIRLIVGLGNVGPEYARTRHNAGFWLAEAAAEALGARFSPERRFHGELARARAGAGDVWLLKPGTYMNRSGQSVQAVASFYRIAPHEMLVAHDELDLPPGEVRIKRGGGTAGHNGLKDIQARLGTPDFWRLRLGIGHPRTLGLAQDVADFVLHPARREEADLIAAAQARALQVLPMALRGEFERATMHLHAPPRREPAAAATGVRAGATTRSPPGRPAPSVPGVPADDQPRETD